MNPWRSKTGTSCGFCVDPDGGPMGLGRYCGKPAVGPHPDPAISYREAFCADHMPSLTQALEELRKQQ